MEYMYWRMLYDLCTDIPVRNIDIYSVYAQLPFRYFYLYGGLLYPCNLFGDFRDLSGYIACDYGYKIVDANQQKPVGNS